MTPNLPIVLPEDLAAERAEAFGKAFRAIQQESYGCAGDIECTFKMDGNCACFNEAFARHRTQAIAEERERCAGIAESWADPSLATEHENRCFCDIATAIRQETSV